MIRELGSGEILYILAAARWTLALTCLSLLFGSLLGLVVTFLRIVPVRPLNWLAIGFISLIQGTPLLGQIFIFFFGLSLIGIQVGPLVAATLAFSINASAFLAEIWRGALQSVPKTQWEASASLGLSYGQRLWHVIVPQAVRISIPPSVGFTVQLIKNTSLASIIGFVEITRAGQIMNNATFAPLRVFLVVAAAYFVICFTLSQVSKRLESRLHVAR